VLVILLMQTQLACTDPASNIPADPAERVDTAHDTAADSRDTGDTGAVDFAVPELPYLLSFHTCPVNEKACGNPINHRVRLAGSEDGASWSLLEWVEPFSGSVPDVLVRDGILYLYSLPELRRIDLATQEVLPGSELTFRSEDTVFHADPSMILDEDGRIVMFFLEGSKGTDPASCPETPCTKRILSATEEAGSLGSVFTVDEGARLELEITEEGPARVSDPDIFVDTAGYTMLISRGQSVRVYHSAELRGTFEAVAKDHLTPGTGGVPAADRVEGQYWLYVSVDKDGGSSSEIQWAALDDLSQAVPEDTLTPISVSPELDGDTMMGSPGFWAVE